MTQGTRRQEKRKIPEYETFCEDRAARVAHDAAMGAVALYDDAARHRPCP